MKTFELNEGDGAVILTRKEDGSYAVKSFLHFDTVDPDDTDSVTDAFYQAALVRGMAYLAATDSDLVIEAGIEFFRQQASADNV